MYRKAGGVRLRILNTMGWATVVAKIDGQLSFIKFIHMQQAQAFLCTLLALFKERSRASQVLPVQRVTPPVHQHALYQKANCGYVAEVSLHFLYICKLYRCIVSQKRNTRAGVNLQPDCTAAVYLLIQVCTKLHIIAKFLNLEWTSVTSKSKCAPQRHSRISGWGGAEPK